ncbi:NADH dehydrogenase, FAD-containing subunit [Actinokineospora alba]|uniref:NADH dehydrogenase, FAD-containing subunit n=1 Tax=Actinokineospora alba TaxID=504798 RepID=A0A1H0WEA3_9PSEU|nr:FAD-dependent oxidoreductase [Actinokineospora alba]TDP68913.1 NADH dehydrogenase FAD-containing subunit [Actinokineospora alba]SDI75057.1 NADH dehydrogenase, FAD-containing subunit [Actinokineospora alba]SDP89034.1 NADH dehydrogenase, FAD-containing subunit [Actinokineospora alba]
MTKHIVVLGAGYSGLIAAKLAAGHADTAVTLVNARDRFVERVRMHQLAAGQELRDRRLADLLDGTGVSLIVDLVTGIDADAKAVRLANRAEPLSYDTLIYALGSQADVDSVPGVREHAMTVAGFEQASAVRAYGTVAVVGGGLTGIEAATELAETCPDLKVRLVTGGVLGGAFSERGRKHVRRVFDRLRIDVRDEVRVAEVRADGVVLADGEHLSADTVVWTTGFRVSPLAREAGFEVDGHGRMVVDDTLRSVSHPDVYGIGDAAAAHMSTGQELRMACATGIPCAVYAVRAIGDRMAGKQARPLKFRYFNQCVSLGRRDGLIQFVRADDSPIEKVLTGRLAAFYKEAIVKGAYLAQRHPRLVSMA